MAAAKGCTAEDAAKAYRLAEERFLAGDVAGAIRLARNAKRLSSLLPALASALAAYEVHAAAAASGMGKNWYAVLGLGGQPATTISHDAVRNQYRRLCLVLHPDKNRSAAADGAFKLLQQAWEALSAIHPPAPASAGPKPRAAASPEPTARQPRPTYTAAPQQPPASKPKAAADDDDSVPPPPPTHKPKPGPTPTWSFKNFGKSEHPRPVRTTIYCWHCDSEFVADGVIHDKSGVKCHKCGVRLRPPWRSRPAPPQHPPPEDRYFPCPGQCPRCATRFSSLVSVGTWHLRCKACSKHATVKVHSRYMATT